VVHTERASYRTERQTFGPEQASAIGIDVLLARSPKLAAPSACAADASDDPLADEIPLKLADCRKDVEQQSPWGRVVVSIA
jgi:hypothetical protein